MSRLDKLPEITDHVLSGLRADDSMKYRVFQKAAGTSDTKKKQSSHLPLAALGAISAVMIAVFVLLAPLASQNKLDVSENYATVEINQIPAGTVLPESPVREEYQKGFPENEKTEDSGQEDSEDETESEKTQPESDAEATIPDPD